MKKAVGFIVIGLVIAGMVVAAWEMKTGVKSNSSNVSLSGDEYESEVVETNAEEIAEVIEDMVIEGSDESSDLAEFFAANFITKDRQEYILQIMESGYDMETVKTVVGFWLDTDEDLSMIDRLLEEIPKDIEEVNYSTVEDAYDRLTENRSGILSYRECKEYSEAGISVEDMIYANKLSKKGYMEIHEILETCKNDGNINRAAVEVFSKCVREQYDFSFLTDDEISKKETGDIFAAAELSRGGVMSIDESFSSEKSPAELAEEIRDKAIEKISMKINISEEEEAE
ncbi:MAG: hypothetical protein J5590_07030 [Clostridia bacterium]|nr:hypothetical protein [Clostridia bacterium]